MRQSNRENEPYSFCSGPRENHIASRRVLFIGRRLLSCTVFWLVTVALSIGQIERSAAAQTPPTALSSDTHHASLPTSSNNSTRVPIDHVFIIVLENASFKRSFGDTDGNGGDACLKAIARQGVLLQEYYGIGHNSMDNYIAMVSGQSPNPATQQDCPVYADFAKQPKGISDLKRRFQTVEQLANSESGKHEFGDWAKALNVAGKTAPTPKENDYDQVVGVGCVYPGQRDERDGAVGVQTIANQLGDKRVNKRWKAYMEGMTKNCDHPKLNDFDATYTQTGDQYATRHNPFTYFHSLVGSGNSGVGDCYNYDVPLGTGDSNNEGLAKDLAMEESTPNYVFIAPNLCNDGHNDPCVNEALPHKVWRNIKSIVTRNPLLPQTDRPRSQIPSEKPSGFPAIHGFLAKWLPLIEKSPAFQNDGLLIITFDEAEVPKETDVTADIDLIHHVQSGTSQWAENSEACCGEGDHPGPNVDRPGLGGPGGGRIGTILISPFVARPGSLDNTRYNHYSMLASIEDQFQVARLGFANLSEITTFQTDPLPLFQDTRTPSPTEVPLACR